MCGSKDLVCVFKLTPTPPANAFVSAASSIAGQPLFPLDVYFCNKCTHVQLSDVVNPKLLFENYVYVSGTSPLFVQHFQKYAEELVKKFTFKPLSCQLAIDIGSNDGTLLEAFKGLGLSVLGIDPASDIAAAATRRGIETKAAFFSSALAAEIKSTWGRGALITANNVFAHADNLHDITQGIADLLAPNGVFVFEASYLVDVLEKHFFDTIYHEHLAYHSVSPLVEFFRQYGLELFSAKRVDSHGGSVRGFVGHKEGPWKPDGSVTDLIKIEYDLGLHCADTFVQFATDIEAIGNQFRDVLTELKNKGKSVAGFGAPAKATTLMYHFGIGPDMIDFIIDDSPLKQGLYSPGMHIPVVSSEELYLRKPDAVVILAWNFANSIMENHKKYRNDGGTFIIPLPSVQIH